MPTPTITRARVDHDGRFSLGRRTMKAPAKVYSVDVLVRAESDQPDVVQLYTLDYQPLGRAVRLPDPS